MHFNIFLLRYKGEVKKLTWTQITEIKISSSTFWCHYQVLIVSYQPFSRRILYAEMFLESFGRPKKIWSETFSMICAYGKVCNIMPFLIQTLGRPQSHYLCYCISRAIILFGKWSGSISYWHLILTQNLSLNVHYKFLDWWKFDHEDSLSVGGSCAIAESSWRMLLTFL